MSPEIEAPRARTCSECGQYTFKPGNPKGWRWAYCAAKKKWFPESIEKPGEKKGCESWE